MGKYSLENYELYKTKKIRPVLKASSDNYGRGPVNYITCSWADLEPRRGCYNMDFILEEVSKAFNPVLVIKPDYPDWIKDNPLECFARLIRRVGSCFMKREIMLIGIVITSISNSVVEWEAYIDGFKTVTLFADIHNYELIRFLKNKNQEFGLRISFGEANWIQACEDLACQNLQDNWERKPTLLHVLDEACGLQVKRQALQWHAGFSNKELDLGFHIALRKLTYPENVSSKGVLPVRFWFVNNGSAPCYGSLCINLQLVREDKIYVIPVPNSPVGWPVGDIIHNEKIPLPSLEEGIYSLAVGLFHKHNVPVGMGIDQKSTDGFYKMGDIRIDHVNRDYINNIWEHYYPEGYYPLEDPGEPEGNG